MECQWSLPDNTSQGSKSGAHRGPQGRKPTDQDPKTRQPISVATGLEGEAERQDDRVSTRPEAPRRWRRQRSGRSIEGQVVSGNRCQDAAAAGWAPHKLWEWHLSPSYGVLRCDVAGHAEQPHSGASTRASEHRHRHCGCGRVGVGCSRGCDGRRVSRCACFYSSHPVPCSCSLGCLHGCCLCGLCRRQLMPGAPSLCHVAYFVCSFEMLPCKEHLDASRVGSLHGRRTCTG
mmetsp:Transcript_123705/g.309180  ORF Transcript_123705/g.309180 Transcript_123705/m.309180 type:complete len:232 (+) Transcript_123705:891-1586(+)